MDARVPAQEHPVTVKSEGVRLDGDLTIPQQCAGIIAFAHGSGSNRHSPRNRAVAQAMHQIRLGTLLISLLSVEEEAHDLITGELRFDIGLLGRRLISIVDWLHDSEETSALRTGLFGSSTGAAGALLAAAERPELVRAVVSRGGRPDLAMNVLDRIQAPTLLIVGGNDFPVIDLNRRAFAALQSKKKMVIVPGATHLFEEPGTMEQVAREATAWFQENL